MRYAVKEGISWYQRMNGVYIVLPVLSVPRTELGFSVKRILVKVAVLNACRGKDEASNSKRRVAHELQCMS